MLLIAKYKRGISLFSLLTFNKYAILFACTDKNDFTRVIDMTELFDLQQTRRTILLGKTFQWAKLNMELIFNTIKETPTAFNAQGSRHYSLWKANTWNDITATALKPLTPAENFPYTS